VAVAAGQAAAVPAGQAAAVAPCPEVVLISWFLMNQHVQQEHDLKHTDYEL
jgi:hypothetical protein